MKEKQKDIFLNHEGNAWFERNHLNIQKNEFGKKDPIIRALLKINKKKISTKKKLLEIGCGEAKRLQWISKNLNINCFGVEPSDKAVSIANTRNINIIQGTADYLDFAEKQFDFVVFGFCLYLCDRSDLFKISKEADRVLKERGHIIILDFYSEKNIKKAYHHLPGVFSYKMDYRKLFDWHPNYKCIFHEIEHHNGGDLFNNENDWIATSVLKKLTNK